ncbi:MAG: RNA polymerase sigma factor [Planctomycetota bacterium]
MTEPELSRELRVRLVARDEEALAEMFDVFFERVWAFLRRSVADDGLAEDLTQDVFLRIYQALPRYDPARALRPWIFTIATNRLRDHWRSGAHRLDRQSVDVDDGALHLPADDGLPADLLEREELAGLVGEAVERLPEGMRLVVQLRAFQDLSFEEIAEVLELQPTAARKRFSRALTMLREDLANHPEALA